MALPSKQSRTYLLVSFSLWGYFLRFFVRQIAARRWPFTIHRNERLGRALFSGNYDSKKGISARAFLLSDPKKGISVNRLTHAPGRQIDRLSQLEAQERTIRARKKNSSAGEIKFYGYAALTAEHISGIEVQGKFLGKKATLTSRNPFHADITLPPDEGKDFYLDMADRLKQKSQFVAQSA